jgi:hypothetical protein
MTKVTIITGNKIDDFDRKETCIAGAASPTVKTVGFCR